MKQYQTVELSFKGEAPKGSYALVDMTATLCHGDSVKQLRGFYDGDGIYKLRFMPENAGLYTYKISGCINAEGSVEVEPCDNIHHGIVRADGTRFVYSDGTPYHAFGTTVYALAHQEEALIDQTIETLGKSPFNKVRMCTFPKFYDFNHNEPTYYPFEKDNEGNWDVHRPNTDFWHAFERRLSQMNELGIEVDLILFHPYDKWGFATMTLEQDLIYLDYLLRRLSALPNVWWSLANEYDLTAKNLEHWYKIEDFIAANDPYHHLLSNHNCFKFWDFTRKNVTHGCMQTKMLHKANAWVKQYGKPIMIDECCYEGNIPHNWGSISAKEMTSRFWKATVVGAYCTHGETYLDDNDVLWWAKGGILKGESPARIGFLRRIIESLPGHLEGEFTFMEKMAAVPVDKRNEVEFDSPGQKDFVEALWQLGDEIVPFMESEILNYCGHIGDDYYLKYYDTRTCAKDTLELPTDKTYTVELIDTWEMTRKTILTKVSGKVEIDLPGKEYTAVLVSKE